MGISLAIVDHAKDFANSGEQTIINDQSAFSEKDIESLNRLIYKTYSGDLLTNIASCKCGELQGEYNYDDDPALSPVCGNCFGRVKLQSDEELKALTWIRAPKGVNGLVVPLVWSMLKERFKSGTFNTIQWICDPYYKAPNGVVPKIVPLLEDMMRQYGWKRGLNNFIDNFDEIIGALLELRVTGVSRNASRSKVNFLLTLLKQNRKKLFPKYLPVPHNSLLVVEEHNSGSFVDQFTPQAINAIQSLAGIDIAEPGKDETTIRLRESRAVNAINGLAEYYENMTSERIARKEGIIRKQTIACRVFWSFRGVISSNTGPHHYRQIKISWGIGITVFRLHLVNKLMTLGFTPNEAIGFLNNHAKRFHPLINRLFKELIAEAPHPLGVSCTINRNPSLQRGSMQSVFIGSVMGENEGEIDIPTVIISILIIRTMNADFDGDQTNFILSLDHNMQNAIEPLAPHMSAFSHKAPRTMSNAMEIPKPVAGTIAEWLEYDEDTPDPAKQQAMAAFEV